MTRHGLAIYLATQVLLLVPAPLGAGPGDRVRVRLGDMSIYTSTAAGQAPRLGFDEGLAPAPSLLPTPEPGPRPAPVRLPTYRPRAPQVATQTPDLSGAVVDLPRLLDTSPGPPDAEFRQRLQAIYGLTQEDHVAHVWSWFLLEDPAQDVGERVGNAVHRWLEGMPPGESWGPERRDPAHPIGYQGSIVSVRGLALRQDPFGARQGRVPPGTSVEVLERGPDNWYRIRGAGLDGWVSGYWLKF